VGKELRDRLNKDGAPAQVATPAAYVSTGAITADDGAPAPMAAAGAGDRYSIS
jgi:hypothetical protein